MFWNSSDKKSKRILCAERMIMTLLLLSLSAPVLLGQQKEATASEKNFDVSAALTVFFCELGRNPEKYQHKIVRITAIYNRWWEGDYLRGMDCYGPDFDIYPEWKIQKENQLKESSTNMEMFVRSNQDNSGKRVGITIVGRFKGWNGIGYGHLGSMFYGFDVLKVEKAFAIPDSVPWAQPKLLASPITEAIEKVKNESHSFLFAFLQSKKATLQQQMSDDFTFINPRGDLLDKTQFLETLSPPDSKKTSTLINNAKYFVYGDIAVVRGQAIVCAGSQMTEQYQLTNILAKREEKWQILELHLTAVDVPQKGRFDPCK
jgi:hypothetical protein